MRVLVWHVHGSWMTSFVQGPDTYLVPILPDRGPDGRGRARTWDWPPGTVEVTPEELADAEIDVVVLQRPHELELTHRWTGRRPGVDVPAVYVEHNAPSGPAVATRHPLADRSDVPVVHVTHFNRLVWDNGAAPTTVVEHGVVDPGYRWTGERARLAVVVNEPVRRTRVAGTDLVLDVAGHVGVDVYGMGMAALREVADRDAPAADLALHEDVRQDELHTMLGRHRAYLHPYRWTSLGLALLEAMAVGLPVLAVAATAAPEAVPPGAGLVTNDVDALVATARRWLADPDEARERGLAARTHVLSRHGIDRFVADWQTVLKEAAR